MNVSHLIKGFPRGSVRRFATLVPFPVDGYPTAQRIIHTPVKKPPPPPPTGDRNPLSNFIIGMITGAIGYGLVNSKTKEILEFEQDYNTLLKLHNELKKVTDQGGVGISFISSSRPIGPNAMPSEKEEYAKNIHLIVEDIHKNHANLIASQAPLVIINGGPGQPGSGMDSITSVVYKLRQLGYHVKQIFCDIRGGFPNESSPDPDIDVFKLGFQMRQLAVISGQYIYVLPGGLGTNYELFQILTLQQLKKLGIDITSTNMNYDFKSITMVSHSGLFNDLNHHLDNAIRIGAVDASEMANIKSIRSLDKTNRD